MFIECYIIKKNQGLIQNYTPFNYYLNRELSNMKKTRKIRYSFLLSNDSNQVFQDLY